MKNDPKKLKLWLLSYLILSTLVFSLGHLWSYTGDSFIGIKSGKLLIVNLFSLAMTFFYYLKITKKTIGWTFNTILLAYFFSALLALFITSVLNSSRNSFANYAVFRISWVLFNTLFIFAGVYSEKKKVIINWDDDILDD